MNSLYVSRECNHALSESLSPPLVPQDSICSPELSFDEQFWFAVYVQVNHEKEVTSRLEQKDVESFLPKIERWSKRRDRRMKVSVPMFPGYVFVRTPHDNTILVHVLKTPGALRLIGNSEGPIPIPAFQIENLQTMLQSNRPFTLNPYLKEGDWVRVVRGPLAGCMGIFLRQNPKKGRLVVSVDIICKSVSVELDLEDVETAQPPPTNVVL